MLRIDGVPDDYENPLNLKCGYNKTTHVFAIAAAVIGAGVLGAGASIYGANKAADAQTSAGDKSISEQQRQFGVTQGELQPFIDFAGEQQASIRDFSNPTSANSPLQQILRMSNTSDPNSPLGKLLALTSGNGTDMNAALESTPGYQFSKEQGQKAVTSSLAARGLAGPGGALAKGSANYAEGLAGTTWQSVVQALQNSYSTGTGTLQNAYSSGSNTLQNIFNTGAGAASSLAGNSTAVGQGVGNNLVGIGNAQAGAATAGANAVGGIGGSVTNGLLLQKLLANNSSGGGGSLYNKPSPTVNG